MKTWLTRAEAAKYCGRTTSWIDVQRKKGRLVASKAWRWIGGWNGHEYIEYQKFVWVFEPNSLIKARERFCKNK